MSRPGKRNELSPYDVFAGMIWHFCINSKDKYYRAEYYDQPVSFQYDTDGVSIVKAYYLGQQNQWTLLFADYQHVRRLVPLILKWLYETYWAFKQQQQAKVPRRSRRRRRTQAQQNALQQRLTKARQNRVFRPQNKARENNLQSANNQ